MDLPITAQDALIYAMVTLSASDRKMTDAELKRIGDIVRTLPAFHGFNEGRLVETARQCGEIVSADDGLELVLQVIEARVPPKLYDTAYALAVEVAAADLHVEREEARFLTLLRRRLGIDALTAAAIERAALVRHRTV